MSFIFEALKRAEEDRRRGDAPPLGTVLQGGPGPRHRRWPWVLVAVGLLANAGALGGWLWTRHGVPGPAEGQPATRLTGEIPLPPARYETSRSTSEPRAEVPEPTDRAARALAFETPIPPVSRVERPAEQGTALVEGPEAASRPRHEGANAVSVSRSSDPGPRGEPPAAPTGTLPPTVAAPQVSPAVQTPNRTPDEGQTPGSPIHRATEPESRATRGPLPLGELPAGVRTRLEKLRVDGHVYRDDPARSFVFIDNHIYRTGDAIGERGPRIETITPDGLVVDYGGGRAKLLVDGGEGTVNGER